MMTDTIDEAFYRLTVAQRDAAWREVKELGTRLSRARKEIAELLPMRDADAFTIGTLNAMVADRDRTIASLRDALDEVVTALDGLIAYETGPKDDDPTGYYEAGERAIQVGGAALAATRPQEVGDAH